MNESQSIRKIIVVTYIIYGAVCFGLAFPLFVVGKIPGHPIWQAIAFLIATVCGSFLVDVITRQVIKGRVSEFKKGKITLQSLLKFRTLESLLDFILVMLFVAILSIVFGEIIDKELLILVKYELFFTIISAIGGVIIGGILGYWGGNRRIKAIRELMD